MTALAQAMILAAGRGERMRPLTDTCPKPMLAVRGQPLMAWPMQALAEQGFTRLVINTAWLGHQISDHFGPSPKLDGCQQLSISYSNEADDFGAALETAGGIVRVLPQLDDVFWVLAGDVFAPDFQFLQSDVAKFVASDALAHLWLVPNPEHNLKGDFGLTQDGRLTNEAAVPAAGADETKFTYSTIGLYKKALFEMPWSPIPTGNPQGVRAALVPIFRAAAAQNRLTGQIYQGQWTDVGTPERLARLNVVNP